MASRSRKKSRDIERAFREQGDRNAVDRKDDTPASAPKDDLEIFMDAVNSMTDDDVAHKEPPREDEPTREGAFETLAAYEDPPPPRRDREELAQLMAAVNSMTDEDAAQGEPGKADRRPKKRKAVLPLVDRIDLHGLTSDEAIKRLKESIKQWAKRGGLYHVIVGKGSHSPQGVGVLRERVWEWLDRQSGQLPIAEFRWGKPNEGGRGVIVLRVRYPSGK